MWVPCLLTTNTIPHPPMDYVIFVIPYHSRLYYRSDVSSSLVAHQAPTCRSGRFFSAFAWHNENTPSESLLLSERFNPESCAKVGLGTSTTYTQHGSYCSWHPRQELFCLSPESDRSLILIDRINMVVYDIEVSNVSDLRTKTVAIQMFNCITLTEVCNMCYTC